MLDPSIQVSPAGHDHHGISKRNKLGSLLDPNIQTTNVLTSVYIPMKKYKKNENLTSIVQQENKIIFHVMSKYYTS